jgi:hypothetical protein
MRSLLALALAIGMASGFACKSDRSESSTPEMRAETVTLAVSGMT